MNSLLDEPSSTLAVLEETLIYSILLMIINSLRSSVCIVSMDDVHRLAARNRPLFIEQDIGTRTRPIGFMFVRLYMRHHVIVEVVPLLTLDVAAFCGIMTSV
jgi:hypothetical protein